MSGFARCRRGRRGCGSHVCDSRSGQPFSKEPDHKKKKYRCDKQQNINGRDLPRIRQAFVSGEVRSVAHRRNPECIDRRNSAEVIVISGLTEWDEIAIDHGHGRHKSHRRPDNSCFDMFSAILGVADEDSEDLPRFSVAV